MRRAYSGRWITATVHRWIIFLAGKSMSGWLASFQNTACISDVCAYLQSSSLIHNLCHRIFIFPTDVFFVLHRTKMKKMKTNLNVVILRVFQASAMIYAMLEDKIRSHSNYCTWKSIDDVLLVIPHGCKLLSWEELCAYVDFLKSRGFGLEDIFTPNFLLFQCFSSKLI